MDICRYEEYKQIIKQDFMNFFADNSKFRFTLPELVAKTIDDFAIAIETSEIEKIMIYAQLALHCIEKGNLLDNICKEITLIINQNSLATFEGKIDSADFEEIKKDLGKIKAHLNAQSNSCINFNQR